MLISVLINDNKKEATTMLKIKTLNPKKSKMVNYIKDHGLSQRLVAECLGMNPQWFNTKLNDDEFGKRDESTIKILVDKLTLKSKKEEK